MDIFELDNVPHCININNKHICIGNIINFNTIKDYVIQINNCIFSVKTNNLITECYYKKLDNNNILIISFSHMPLI